MITDIINYINNLSTIKIIIFIIDICLIYCFTYSILLDIYKKYLID
jgi:hypothetical protein